MVNKKEKEKLSCCEKIARFVFITAMITIVLTFFVLTIMQSGQQKIDIALSQEVADEICIQLTGEDYVVASDDYFRDGFGNGGNLVCDVLDEGSTKGIIVNR